MTSAGGSGSGGRGALAIALVAVLAIAAVLRTMGIGFGLPAVYNPDEIAIMSRTLAFAKGDLNPHNFLYPTFYFYVLFGWLGLYFVIGWLTGFIPSLSAFQSQFFLDPTGIYLAGRVLGVVCGVATVLAAYVWTKRIASRTMDAERTAPFTGRLAGVIAALFLAVAPTAVRDAHYVKHDVPVTLAIVLAQIAIAGLLTRSNGSGRVTHRQTLLAGAACGVAFSTHYYAVFLALPLAFAIWQREHERGLSAVIAAWLRAGAAAAVLFFALSPFILVEPMVALTDITANRRIVVDRVSETAPGLLASAPAYAEMLWREAVGWPVLLLSAVGLGWCLKRDWRLALLLVSFAAPFLLFISRTVAAGRYLNPILPTIALLAALGTMAIALRVAAALRTASDDHQTASADGPATGLATGLAVLLALAAAAPGAMDSLRLDRLFQQTDTRTLGLEWIERHVPSGATVLIQPYSVPLTQSRDSLVEALTHHLGSTDRASTKFALRLALKDSGRPVYRTLFLGDGGLDVDKVYLSPQALGGDAGLARLRAAGVQFVVLKRYNAEGWSGAEDATRALHDILAAHGRLRADITPYGPDVATDVRARVASFQHNTDTPYDVALARPGPGLEIWELP